MHAFVSTHNQQMMMFEADTYGFRLVVPMYAPMIAVAAQLPVALIQRLLARPGTEVAPAWSRLPVGLAALAVVGAVVQQGRGLADVLPVRDLNYHGLGGAAAHAATTAEQANADVIYVASIDGTPRRFGSGNLPGLQYPRFKWFDPRRSVPVPSSGVTAVYGLSELVGQPPSAWGVATCLGAPDSQGALTLNADDAARRCLPEAGQQRSVGARFGGVAQVDSVVLPPSANAGQQVPATLVWEALAAHPTDAYQTFIHLLEPDAATSSEWGNGTGQLYPSSEWEPGERIVSILPVATDPTAVPGAYRLDLGFVTTKGNSAPLRATWSGGSGDTAPIGTMALIQQPTTTASLPPLPAGMKLLPMNVEGGGLELVASRSLPASAKTGDQLDVGLLWRAMQDQPSASAVQLELKRQDGQVVQQTTAPLLGGRYPPSELRAGTVVRDEQLLVVGPRAPDEQLSLGVQLLDASGAVLSSSQSDVSAMLGTISVQGRSHNMQPPADLGTPQNASFGDKLELLGTSLAPATAKPGAEVSVRLHWKALAEMDTGYKVFIHVLDATQTQVLAQRDAEPHNGEEPTTGWLPGEYVDDEYKLSLPANLPAGEYPVEVGVYDPRSGQRLVLSNGDSRLLLGELAVAP